MSARILLVDDDRVARTRYRLLLRHEGHEVKEVDGADEAWQELHRARLEEPERPYQLVITDLHMPLVDGTGFVKVLRDEPALRHLPVLMLTGSPLPEDRIDSVEQGASGFMQKHDNDMAEFLAWVHNLLSLKRMQDEVEELSRRDQLTGLWNRRHGVERLEEELSRCARYDRGLAVALVDVDRFKRVNDTFGHQAGDEVLVAVATALAQVSRQSDLVIRWGGEEFLFVFPETSLAEASAIVERFRRTLETHPVWISAEGGRDLRVTISGGVAQLQHGDGLESLVERADVALYRAKEHGRNRLLVSCDGHLLPVSAL